MSKLRVWLADKMSAKAAEVLRARGIEVIEAPGLPEEEKRRVISEVDGVIVRSATKIKGALLDAARRLKIVARAGIGVDNIDIEACSRRGIVVVNTPHGNAVTTAELAVALICAAARMIPQANASTKAGKWEKNRFMGIELTGKTAGVVGVGNIGAIVCDRLKGLRMRVVVYDPYLSDERAEALGVEKMDSLEELVAIADVITLHVPLTERTRGLIDRKMFARMKPGAILVNCARGGIVDEAALVDALQRGRLRAAAVDVYEEEPARAHPLFALENAICTPHIGASTIEAQENVAVQAAEQVADYLLAGVLRHAVNAPSLSVEEQRRIAPYLELARRLGRFLSGVVRPGFSRVRFVFEGEAAKIDHRIVIHETLAGLLSAAMDDVNAINAPMLARERGIAIDEVLREQSATFNALIRITVEGGAQDCEVAGALFDGRHPRIIAIDGCELEAAPEGNLIFLRNVDRPGVIAAIGRVLAEANVNIADFRLGRRPGTDQAVALVRVDSPPPVQALERIAALEEVLVVRYLELPPLSPKGAH